MVVSCYVGGGEKEKVLSLIPERPFSLFFSATIQVPKKTITTDTDQPMKVFL